jgi:hypothetical protein
VSSVTRVGLGLLVVGLLLIPLPGPGFLILSIGFVVVAAGLIMSTVSKGNRTGS